jgi:hypothetical protein
LEGGRYINLYQLCCTTVTAYPYNPAALVLMLLSLTANSTIQVKLSHILLDKVKQYWRLFLAAAKDVPFSLISFLKILSIQQ